MTSDLFEVISLASRYLFSLLGVLIVLRAFHWLFSDSRSTRRLRNGLFFSGMVGEWVVIVPGSDELSEGQTLSVPWEGVLGSVRSCDIYIPDSGIRRSHLSFSFENGRGLLIRLWSGCEAWINSIPVDCRTERDTLFLQHGDYLQAGNTILRLRLFSSLDLPSTSVNNSNGIHTSSQSLSREIRTESNLPWSDTGFSSSPENLDSRMSADAAFPESFHPVGPNPAFPSSCLNGIESGEEKSVTIPDLKDSISLPEHNRQAGSQKESNALHGNGWEADWSE